MHANEKVEHEENTYGGDHLFYSITVKVLEPGGLHHTSCGDEGIQKAAGSIHNFEGAQKSRSHGK